MSDDAILVVDDTLESLGLLTDILEAAGYHVLPANSGELALAALAANRPKLILLDILMPGMDGLEVLRRLKARPETHETPVIILSAFSETAQRVKCLEQGAIDFISKPFQRLELLAKVKIHFELSQTRMLLEEQSAALRLANERLQREIAENKALQCKLEQQVNTDFLTGCASRRHFLEHAEQELQRIRRYGGEMSILMLDLDHFKQINDSHGHQAGDITLQTFVNICQELMREVDVMGRVGGEEFAILLPETGIRRAVEVAERLCQAIAAARIRVENAPSPIRFTTSIGVASSTAADTCFESIVKRADRALYQAKNSGRNRVCVLAES